LYGEGQEIRKKKRKKALEKRGNSLWRKRQFQVVRKKDGGDHEPGGIDRNQSDEKKTGSLNIWVRILGEAEGKSFWLKNGKGGISAVSPRKVF